MPQSIVSGNELGVNVKSNFQHIDWMTMDISDDYVTYDLDIMTPEGKILLKNANEQSAREMALSRAIQANQCDAIFEPRVTFVRGARNKILRVTVYGRTAKYKKNNNVNSTNIGINISD